MSIERTQATFTIVGLLVVLALVAIANRGSRG